MSAFIKQAASIAYKPVIGSAGILSAYYLLVGDCGIFDPRYYKEVQSPILDAKMARVFRYQLDQINQKKNKDEPVALILCAEEDWNGALSGRAFRRNIFSLSETHKIAFQTIHQPKQIGAAIKQISQSEKAPHILVIAGHGNPNSIQLGSSLRTFTFTPISYTYSIEDVQKRDFAMLPLNAQIILDSCSTGNTQDTQTGPCLAEEIAKAASPRPVFAPRREVSANGLSYRYCTNHNQVEISNVEDWSPRANATDEVVEISRSFFGKMTRRPIAMKPPYNRTRLFQEFKVEGNTLRIKNAPWPCIGLTDILKRSLGLS